MCQQSSKVSAILIITVLLTACTADTSPTQPTERVVAEEKPTLTPTLVPSTVPTIRPTTQAPGAPSEVPTSLPAEPTLPLVPRDTPEDPELNLVFTESVLNYAQTVWGTWEKGETVGQCLIDNALSISVLAREVIIQYGVEEAFGKLDGQDLQSLSAAWDLC